VKSIDKITDKIRLDGVKSQVSTDRKVAWKDIDELDLTLQDNFEEFVDEYLCSVLNVSYRLPPFDFLNINGYSFLRIRPQLSED